MCRNYNELGWLLHDLFPNLFLPPTAVCLSASKLELLRAVWCRAIIPAADDKLLRFFQSWVILDHMSDADTDTNAPIITGCLAFTKPYHIKAAVYIEASHFVRNGSERENFRDQCCQQSRWNLFYSNPVFHLALTEPCIIEARVKTGVCRTVQNGSWVTSWLWEHLWGCFCFTPGFVSMMGYALRKPKRSWSGFSLAWNCKLFQLGPSDQAATEIIEWQGNSRGVCSAKGLGYGGILFWSPSWWHWVVCFLLTLTMAEERIFSVNQL